jgi:RNA polymerase sigma-70 factor (ECF subfamily)
VTSTSTLPDDAGAQEADLMRRLAAGEREGPVRVLYRRYGGRLYGLGMRLLGDEGMAEDLVQETFVRLWRSAPGFDPERGSLRTFLFTLARRAAVDLQRRPSTRPLRTVGEGDDEPGTGEDPTGRGERAFDQALLSLDVRAAMGQLSDAHREVLELHYDEDLTQRKIAERLDIPLGTVKTRTLHALRGLRGMLEADDVLR